MFHNLKRWLFGSDKAPTHLSPRFGVRLAPEVLEPRDVPATFTVNDPRDIALAAIPLHAQRIGPPVPTFMTLRAALESSEATAGADTIDFDMNALAPAGGGGGTTYLHLSSQLIKANAAEEVTIVGPGANTLGIQADATANNQFRIMSMTGGKVTVTDLTFKDGWVTGDGGAIQVVAGILDVTRCNFFDNTASGNGGAISHVPGPGNAPDVGPLTITNCWFEGNEAATSGTSFGGAIHTAARDTAVTIVGSRFLYNWAGKYGGAISVSAGNQKQILIQNATGQMPEGSEAWPSLFAANSAERGGAIAVLGGGMTVNVRATTFNENIGRVTAGAIYFSAGGNSYFDCFQSKFLYNRVTNTGGAGDGTGGAVELDTQDAKFEQCTFTGNTAMYGGAIFVNGATVELLNSQFDNNTASVLGPTICYVGILGQSVWVVDVGSNLARGDVVQK